MSEGFPNFLRGKLLFCNGGLAATCCPEIPDDPGEVEGWDDYGYFPSEDYVWKKNKRHMIGCLCPIKDCDAVENTVTGRSWVFASLVTYPTDLTDAQRRLMCDGGKYYLVDLKGPFDDAESAIAVLIAHYDALKNYADNCVCTISGPPSGGTSAGITFIEGDEEGFYWTCQSRCWGSGGQDNGEDPISVVARWGTDENEFGIYITLEISRSGERWVGGYGNTGSAEFILNPCDRMRFGAPNPDSIPGGAPWEPPVWATVEWEAIGSTGTSCTTEIQAAFSAVPNSTLEARMLEDLGE